MQNVYPLIGAWFKDQPSQTYLKKQLRATYDEYVRDLGLEDKALLNLYNEENFECNRRLVVQKRIPIQVANYTIDYKVLQILKDPQRFKPN